MPIFEYRCNKCGHEFEHLVFSSDKQGPTCPKCRSSKVKKMMSAASVRAHGIPTGSGGFKEPACRPSGG